MKRHIPGLHSQQQIVETNLDGLFLVRVEGASYRWHPQKPFLVLRFVVLEPAAFRAPHPFTAGLYCTERALWKLDWFLRDFEYDMDIAGSDQIDEKALIGLRGVVRTSPKLSTDALIKILMPSPRRANGKHFVHATSGQQ